MIGRVIAVAAIRVGAAPHAVLLTCQLSAGTTLAAAALTAAAAPAATSLPPALLGVSVAAMGPCYALLLGQGIDAAADAAAGATAGATAAKLVSAGALGGATWAAAVASAPADLQPVAVTSAACRQ